MRKISRFVLTLALAAIIAAPLIAQDKKGKKKKKKQGNQTFTAVRIPKSIDLTGEQKEKIEAINKGYSKQLREFFKKRNQIFTPEQRKARREVQQIARKEKKQGKALQEALSAVTKLTDDQKKQVAVVNKERDAFRKVAAAKIREILTADQKAKLKTAGKRKGKRMKKKDTDK